MKSITTGLHLTERNKYLLLLTYICIYIFIMIIMIYIFRYVIIYPLRSLLNVGELKNRERIILMPQKYLS